MTHGEGEGRRKGGREGVYSRPVCSCSCARLPSHVNANDVMKTGSADNWRCMDCLASGKCSTQTSCFKLQEDGVRPVWVTHLIHLVYGAHRGKKYTCLGHLANSESVEGRKEMFYLTTHSTHFIYGYTASDIWQRTIQITRERKPAAAT